MSENVISAAEQEALNDGEQVQANQNDSQNQLANLGLIETHLQISNIVKILFTVNHPLLTQLVEKTPVELQDNPHFNVLKATLGYYNTLIDINTPKQAE